VIRERREPLRGGILGAYALALAMLSGAATAQITPAAVAGQPWRIDGTASEARFRVRLFGLVPLNGRFDDFSGTVRIDTAAQLASVEATVAAASVRMRSPRNAEWVRSAEFFDAANHPYIRFVSADFPLALLEIGGDLDGRITLRGVTRRVRFAVVPRACSLDEATCELDVNGRIERSAFDMTTRRGVLSDEVVLRFRIVARPAS
jgi:polyisoprenoid-binding protein YceI